MESNTIAMLTIAIGFRPFPEKLKSRIDRLFSESSPDGILVVENLDESCLNEILIP